MTRRAITPLLYCVLLLLPAVVLSGGKTDVIYLKNGDRITGEFKTFLQGELELSTSDIGTIRIKWEAIDRIQSDKWILLETKDGTRYFGTLPDSGTERILSLQTIKDEPLSIAMDNVVRAEQIKREQAFLERVGGYGKVGFNYTKASEVFQGNMAFNANYRTREYISSFELSTNVTRNSGGPDTRRAQLGGNLIWLRPQRWFWFGSLLGEQNDELGIDLRLSGTGGGGRFLVQSQRSELYAAGGLTVSREYTARSDGGLDDNNKNLEGLFALDWTFFKLYSPKSRIKLSTALKPSLTDSGRYRGNARLNMRQELYFDDLFWDIDIYYDYDSKPPAGANSKDDYGVVTSLGYEF